MRAQFSCLLQCFVSQNFFFFFDQLFETEPSSQHPGRTFGLLRMRGPLIWISYSVAHVVITAHVYSIDRPFECNAEWWLMASQWWAPLETCFM